MQRNKHPGLSWIPFFLVVFFAPILFRTGGRSFAAVLLPTVEANLHKTIQSKREVKGGPAGLASVPLLPQHIDLVAVRGDEPYDIAISPDGSRAYVPARNTDNLFVIDLDTHQILKVIDLYPEAEHPLGPAPDRVALTPDGARLLVTNANDASVTLLDTATLTAIRTLRFNGQPQDLAIAPDGSVAYVSINAPDAIVKVIDVAATEVLTSTPGVPHASQPVAVAFAPDGSRAYLAMMSGDVLILDPVTHTVSDTLTVPGGEAIGDDLIVNGDGTTGYVSALNDDTVLVLDLINRQVKDAFAVDNPEGLALSADERYLYVGTFGYTGESAYNLEMLDAQSGARMTGINFVHPAPYGRGGSDIQRLSLTPDGSLLYAASVDADGVFVVDPATLSPQGMIPTQAIASFFPLRAALSPDGAYLYVGGGIEEPTTVSVIDTATLEVVADLRDDRAGSCMAGTSGLTLSPDGSLLYALSSDCNELLVFDTVSRTLFDELVLGTPGTPLPHVAVHPDGDEVYVLDHGGNVYVIDPASLGVTDTLATAVEQAWTLKLAPDGTRGYVTGAYGYAVLDLTTHTVVKQTNYCDEYVSFCHVHGRALGVTPNGSQYLVGEFFTLHVYDAATDTESTTIDLSDWNPGRTLVRDLVFSSDGTTGYAAMWDEKAVLAFDADTWQVTAKIDTGRAPYFGVCPVWLALSPDGDRLYAVAEESDNVVVIDTAMNAVIGTVRVGKPYPAFLPVGLKNAVAPTIIAGSVTDAQGTPLADVRVSAGSYDTILNCGSDEFWATSNADGSYHLNVTPGNYLVYVNSHHQLGSYIPEAYPNVNSWSRIGMATRINVDAGQRVADVDLSLPAGFTVSGRLVDGDGQPVLGAGGNIQDNAQDIEFGCALGFGSSNTDGTFQVNVPAGTYDFNFCTESDCHRVIRDQVVNAQLELGDVLFAEGP